MLATMSSPRPEPAVIRPARPNDAADLARLIDLAGEGLPRHVWAAMAGPGEDVWEVGRRRAARDAGAFCWRNASVAEAEGRTAAALVAYRVADLPEPLDGLSPALRPLQALENAAPGTFYINVLAAYPAFRRRGIARALLAEAARRSGGMELSLTVADRNEPALALYRAVGFVETARTPLVEDGWTCDSRNWILMRAPAAAVVRACGGSAKPASASN